MKRAMILVTTLLLCTILLATLFTNAFSATWMDAGAGPAVQGMVARGLASLQQERDPAVDEALGLLSETASGHSLADLATQFRAGGGTISFEQIPSSPDRFVFGDFRGVRRGGYHGQLAGKISINGELVSSPEIVASVIAHEASHLENALRPEFGALNPAVGCFDTEAQAFIASMGVWGELRQRMQSPSTSSSPGVQNALRTLERHHALYSGLFKESTKPLMLQMISREIEQVYADECVSALVRNHIEGKSGVAGSRKPPSLTSTSATIASSAVWRGEDSFGSSDSVETLKLAREAFGPNEHHFVTFELVFVAATLLGAGIAFLAMGLAQAALGQIVLGLRHLARR